jgi:hypothetical protein
MNFVERDDIDTEKWDYLVRNTPGSSVFSLSVYMDHAAENWCLFVDDDYTRGIALPYREKLGIKTCYTPVFVRYLEWFGLPMDNHRFTTALKSYFRSGALCTKQKIRTKNLKRRVFQFIELNAVNDFSNQTLRMMERFKRSEVKLEWTDDISYVLQALKAESFLKLNSLDRKSLKKLEELAIVLNENKMLRVLVALDGEEYLGGLLLVPFNGQLLYLRGAFGRNSKYTGIMYGSMKTAIELALDSGMGFDFFGSNDDDLKRFNYNLGGEDKKYYKIEWDNSPFWYQFVMKFKIWDKRK